MNRHQHLAAAAVYLIYQLALFFHCFLIIGDAVLFLLIHVAHDIAKSSTCFKSHKKILFALLVGIPCTFTVAITRNIYRLVAAVVKDRFQSFNVAVFSFEIFKLYSESLCSVIHRIGYYATRLLRRFCLDHGSKQRLTVSKKRNFFFHYIISLFFL